MVLKVIQIRHETDNVFSLILQKPVSFHFYAGQYLDVELPVTDKFGKSRAFTISSSPTEDFLMISSKKGITPFKKFMEQLRRGYTITTSHPVGTFTLDESTPAVFIAGGIGITPFRSMIKYALDKKISTAITLIYSASDDFTFKKEFDHWQKQLPNLTIKYLNTSKEGRLSRNKLLKTIYDIRYTIYYLAGSPKMVDDLENILLKLGIDQTNIRTDRFDGY